jgi:AsmA protein
MRKILILGAVLLVLAGALFFAAINLNHYLAENRAWLAEQASAALGRPVAFDEIGVSLRGGLGARVTSVAIGEDPTFGKGDFLRAGRIDAVIKILPALRGRYEVARVEIDAPEIHVIKTRSGFNFDSLGRASGNSARPAEQEPPAAGALPLLVSSVRIRDGKLQYVDRSSSPASELGVEHLDFAASDVGLDQPIQLDLAAALLGAAEQNVRVAGTLGPLGSPEAAASAPLDLRVDLGPLVVDRLKKIALIGDSIPAELSSPDPIALSVKLSGKLDALGTILSMDATDAAIAYGDQFKKPKGVRFKVDADVKRAKDAIDVSAFDLQLAKAQLNGQGRIGLTPGMSLDFQLSGRGVPLDGWGDLIPASAAVETAGTVDLDLTARGPVGGGQIPRLEGTLALQRVSARQPKGDTRIEDLTTRLTFRGNRVEIPPTDFRLNGNPVRVAATVKDLGNLDTDFDITSPALDIAALGAGGEGLKQREVLEDVEVRGNFRSANGGPQLDATVRSNAGSLRDIAYRTLDGRASLRGQKLTVDPLTLSAFDGNIAGAGSYDMAKPDVPVFSFRGRVDGVDVGALAAHFGGGRTLQMAGRLKANLDLNGRGSEWEVIRQALTGNGALEVADGVLKGVNIAESILGSLTGIPGLSGLISPSVRSKYPELFGVEDTVFEALAGKMTLGDGVALLDEIALAARDYRLDGKGTIRLDNALDIAMTFVGSQNLTADLIRSVTEIQYLTNANGRFQLPLRLGGSMPSFRAQPDLQYVTQQLSASLVQTGLSKGLEALIGKPKTPTPPAASDAGIPPEKPAGSTAEAPTAPDTGPPAGSTAEPPAEPDAGKSAPPVDPAEELIRRGLGTLLGGDKE